MGSSQFYRLRGHEVEPMYVLLDWAAWYETADRRVARTSVAFNGDDVEVSTIFLGLDHGWRGPPILFETMCFLPAQQTLIFGRLRDVRHDLSLDGFDTADRYSTWAEAEAGHARIVANVQRAAKAIEVLSEAALAALIEPKSSRAKR